MTTETSRLWDVIERYLGAEQVELDDLDVRGRGRGRIVRVTVDAEGGVGVDRIAELSRGLSRILDDEDPLPGSYTLEVTSPGLERVLRRPAHYRKAIGRDVVVKTAVPVEGSQRHEGTLRDADDEAVTVVVDGVSRRISIGDVTQAKTVFRWERAPKPGRKRGGP